MTVELGEYKGRPVVGMRGKLTKTGDGLSESLAIDPADLKQGDRVFILTEAVVEDHTYKRVAGTGANTLVVTFQAETMTLVDADFAEQHIKEQKERNLLAKEAKAGITRLPATSGGGPDLSDQMAVAHADGFHDGRIVQGCPTCATILADMAEEGAGAKPAPRKRRGNG